MSATINANDLKFTIFGAGHDYTLADSGEGEKVFFSHPFVPKGARAYAGQYLIYAPVYDDSDETDEPVMTDVVKEDRTHCTFTPSLGTVFNTVGQQTIKIHYRREYVYPESTILVEKELEQTIEVVDHGTIDHSDYLDPDYMASADTYTDGYVYLRPNNDTVTEYQINAATWGGIKVSTFPWRTVGIQFTDDITDISEWEYADTRNLTGIDFDLENLTDIEPLSKWDTSKFTYLRFTWGGNDLEPLSKWDVSNVVSLRLRCETETLKPLKNWDVSSVEDMSNFFIGFSHAKTLEGVENWDVSSVTNMNRMCGACVQLEDISALSNWDVSSVTDLSFAFLDCIKLTSLHGLENWDVSSVETMEDTFSGCYFLSDISALSNWDVSNVENMTAIFQGVGALCDLQDILGWDVSKAKAVYPRVSALYYAFDAIPFYHSNELGKDLVYVNSRYRDYDYNTYVISDPSTLVKYTKDASAVANWDVQDIPAYAFNAEWSNIPSWN